MSADGNSGATPIDYDGEYQGALARIRVEVDGLAASRAVTETLRQRGVAPEPLAKGLRYSRKNDFVDLAIDEVKVTAIMSHDGTRDADLVAEGDAWSTVLGAFDTVSAEAAADPRRDLWSWPLADGIAVIAWRTESGQRIVVHGPRSSRLAYTAAVRALKRGVIPVAVLLAGWRLLRRIATHPSAAASTVALVVAGSALAVAAMRPVTGPAGNGPAPTATATVFQPAYPSSPGIAHQTGGATTAERPDGPRACSSPVDST